MSSLSLPPRNAEIQTQPITLKSKPTFQSSRQLTWGFRLWRQIELLLHLGEIHYRDSNPRSSVGHLNVWPILVATGVNFKFAGHRNFFSIQKRFHSLKWFMELIISLSKEILWLNHLKVAHSKYHFIHLQKKWKDWFLLIFGRQEKRIQ